MARTKLNDEIKESIISYIENGSTFKDAAVLSGIHESTFYIWLKRGRNAKSGKFHDFYLAMEEAKARNKQWHIQNINKDRSWQSSAWVLERRYREEYGRYDKLEVEADVETKVKNVFEVSDEELDEILNFDDSQDEFTDDL